MQHARIVGTLGLSKDYMIDRYEFMSVGSMIVEEQ